MQTLLVVITLGSLAMTLVLAAVLVRLIRFERRREAARIELLREMAEQATDELDVDIAAEEDARDFQIRDTIEVAPVASNTDLFAQPEPASAWPRRAAVAAAVAVLVVAGVFGLRHIPRSAGAPAPATQAAAVSTTGSTDQKPSLLELVSLKQTQDTKSLTITGLVQNPRDGAALSKISATAMAFSADGTFLASGRAPLDFTTLRPGDESGFVITVPVDAPVARYRVGFRSEDGHVIGHIDRRSSSTLATGTASIAMPARGTS